MKTLYLDCSMGAAGDMLTAALLELLPDPDAFLAELNTLGLPGVRYVREASEKCGVTGTHVSVLVCGHEEDEGGAAPHHDHGHHAGHTDMEDIGSIVSALPVSDQVRADILAVYGLIAEAESHAHGVPVTEVHFHEVGALDAVADVTAVCLLAERIAPDEIVASPVCVGSGTVRCAHGILPVPAPATAYILRDVPIYAGSIQSELSTPTGAALLKHLVGRFGPMPLLKTEAVGYGMGKKSFPQVNCVRAFLGQSGGESETMLELSCNLDDMTAEEIGFAMERLLEAGAREVYTVPVGMKKNRPGTLLRVICPPADRERLLELIFRHTSTLGVRETATRRYILDRWVETVETPWGPVRRKCASGYGTERLKYEYEDLARVARKNSVGLDAARKMVEKT